MPSLPVSGGGDGLMDVSIITWADGFGRWHAKVPKGLALPHTWAYAAINEELKVRDEIGKPGRLYGVEVLFVEETERFIEFKEK